MSAPVCVCGAAGPLAHCEGCGGDWCRECFPMACGGGAHDEPVHEYDGPNHCYDDGDEFPYGSPGSASYGRGFAP